MNIFVLSNNIEEIVKWQMDKHCVKMPLESCQMLSTAHRILDGSPIKTKSKNGRNVTRYVLDGDKNDIIYGVSHANHPCTKWTMETSENYKWHYNLLVEMFKEYTFRYGKIHACERLLPYLENIPKNIKIGAMTPFATAMPDDVKVKGDSVASYRNYYQNNKQHLASWSGKINSRPVPQWFSYQQ